MSKELYDWYKSKGMCTKCGINKARQGYTMCWDCAADSNERSQDYYHNKMTEDQYKRRLAYNKRKRELCVAFGVCRNCLKKDATNGKFCLECYIKSQRSNAKRRECEIKRADRVEYGLCYFCGEPVVEGKKTCPKCYENRKNGILRNKYDNKNHNWRRVV